LLDLRREHLIDQVCIQEILPRKIKHGVPFSEVRIIMPCARSGGARDRAAC
jgi:hypothetical protein